MRRILLTLLFGLLCLVAGFSAGVWLGPQFKSSSPGKSILTLAQKVPWAKLAGQPDENSPFETYNYPTIKWRPKALADPPGSIVQLWTTYQRADKSEQPGKMDYRLTVFKAPDKGRCEVQLLDDTGFKVTQFDASDFYQIPGAPDIMEARDSHSISEDEYKRVRDYSVK